MENRVSADFGDLLVHRYTATTEDWRSALCFVEILSKRIRRLSDKQKYWCKNIVENSSYLLLTKPRFILLRRYSIQENVLKILHWESALNC